jgi:hypothetical protein
MFLAPIIPPCPIATYKTSLNSSLKKIAFWNLALCGFVEVERHLIALMTEAVIISETSVYFPETTWHNIPERCHLYTRRRENMKSHNFFIVFNIFNAPPKQKITEKSTLKRTSM